MIWLLLACATNRVDSSSGAQMGDQLGTQVEPKEAPQFVHVDDFDPADWVGKTPPIVVSTPIADAGSGINCASSCTGPDPANHDVLEAELIPGIFEEWNSQAIGEPTIELETLLFYLADTRAFIAEKGTPGLDEAHAAYLQAELARDTVSMEMRLINDEGEVTGFLSAPSFPLWEKQHLTFTGTGTLGHLETGGKAKRVGLAHLWTRW